MSGYTFTERERASWAAGGCITNLDDLIYRCASHHDNPNPPRRDRDWYYVRLAQYLAWLRDRHEWEQLAIREGWTDEVFQPLDPKPWFTTPEDHARCIENLKRYRG